MKRDKLCILAVSLLFIVALTGFTHRKPHRSAENPTHPAVVAAGNAVYKANEEKVRDLVAFLQLLLNTLGSSTTSVRDKDIVITESYAKIFRDAKVQVEDDLDQNRSTITNKDVVAYLKDVDFFFVDAAFELVIEDIKKGVNANGQVFYKVSLRRTLTGTTVTGKTVKNTIPRYIEINFDPEASDLKIVSIYTNEFDETEALTNWWKTLSYEWKSIFKRRLNIMDSVKLSDIKDMTALSELDLNGNEYVQTIEPLGRLTNLRLLFLSGTNIADLTPIRNLTELVELDVSRTKVFDLNALRYAAKLETLNIGHTDVRSVAVLEKMTSLQNLAMEGTHVFDFAPLTFLKNLAELNLRQTQVADAKPIGELTSLVQLNVAQTNIQDLTPVQTLTNLTSLNIDSTLVRDISALNTLTSLEVLSANHTFISSLSPLKDLAKLKRVYCDQTPVTKSAADAFMAENPEVLVIYNSKDLQAWWSTLPQNWKRVLTTAGRISDTPGKEELASLPNIDSVNFSNDRAITSLEPLRRLQKLQVIIASNTAITDLSPLRDHREIRKLNIADTEVTDLSPLARFSRLEVFIADRSAIGSIEPLAGLRHLQQVYVDRTDIHDITAREFLEKNPGCLLVYKTIHLNRWWSNLPAVWKDVFMITVGTDTTRESLHRLVELEKFKFEDPRISELTAFSEFVRLKELHFSGTAVAGIPETEALRSLLSLHATNSPLQEIGAIAALSELADLDISNTPVRDLRGLEELRNLRSLNCAGTQVKKLDPLRPLVDLQSLDCSNTSVSKLDPVTYLSLRSLKAYNTRISSRRIENFQLENPECGVVYYR